MRHIGKESKRIIADDVVTGKAVYTADIRMKNLAHGRALRSPHQHAKILSIDYSEAMKMDGVHAVVTHEDVGENVYITNGFTPPKHNKPLDSTVRYVGDVVALVVADTEALADKAMKKIKVEYEVLPAVNNIEEALADGAPQLYKQFPNNIAPAKQNIKFENGDVEAGFEEADVVVEVEAQLRSGQNPMPVEPPTIITDWDGDFLNITGSISAIAYCQQNVAASMDMPYENIRTVAPLVGGSFGSKLFSGNVQPIVFSALMSKKARRPVIYTYTKEEHFACHQNRMETIGKVKLGVDKNGKATAISVKQYADAGYCATTQEFMVGVGTNTPTVLCRTPNVKYDADVVVTNKMASGSFRGYGYLESTVLITNAIVDACEQLDLDPVEYFKINALRHGDQFFNPCAKGDNQKQVSVGPNWDEMLVETAEAFKWKDRFKGWGKPTWESEDGRFARGVGVACAGHVDVGGKPSNTNVILAGEGGVVVQTVMTEFGTGTRDVYQKIVAEVFDMPLERVKVSPADTMAAPADFGSTGSRSTYAGGISAKWAAEHALDQLLARASMTLDIPKDDLGFKDSMVYQKSNPENKWPMAPTFMGKVDSITGVGNFPGVQNAPIFHTQFVEVEVDKELGTFKIIDHYGGSDAGVIINPTAVKNQVQSFFPGIDLAVYEETIMDEHDNRVLNPNMIDYKTRLFNMAPKHDHIVLESFKDKESVFPFGAFGVGEPLLGPGAPAVRMALYNAIGVKLNDYPFLPNKILSALKEKEAAHVRV